MNVADTGGSTTELTGNMCELLSTTAPSMAPEEPCISDETHEDAAADVAAYRGHAITCTALVSPEGACHAHAAIRSSDGRVVALLTATDRAYSHVDAAKARALHEARLWLDRRDARGPGRLTPARQASAPVRAMASRWREGTA